MLRFPTRKRLCALTPDGDTLLAPAPKLSRVLALTRTTTGEHLASLDGGVRAPIVAVAVNQNGRQAAVAHSDGAVVLWDLPGRKRGPVLLHRTGATTLTFRADGEVLLVGCADGTVRMWEVQNGAPRGAALAQEGIVCAADFTPDGKAIVVAVRADAGDHRARSLRFWDVSTGRPLGPPVDYGNALVAHRFNANGQELLTATGLTHSIDIRRLPLPLPPSCAPGRLKCWVEVVTGMELERAGGERVLNSQEWAQRKLELARLGGPPLAPAADEEVVWHRHQSQEAERTRAHFAAAWHLGQLIRMRPEDVSLYLRRASARAMLGQVTLAARDIADAERLGVKPANVTRHGWLPVWLRLAVDPPQERRRLTDAMLTQAEASDDGWIWHVAVRMSTVFSESLGDVERPVRLIRRAVLSNPQNPTYRHSLGLALYRAGKPREALAAFAEAARRLGRADTAPAERLLLQALAHAGTGDPEQARRCYREALDWLERNATWAENNQPSVEEVRRFRAEAEKALSLP